MVKSLPRRWLGTVKSRAEREAIQADGVGAVCHPAVIQQLHDALRGATPPVMMHDVIPVVSEFALDRHEATLVGPLTSAFGDWTDRPTRMGSYVGSVGAS